MRLFLFSVSGDALALPLTVALLLRVPRNSRRIVIRLRSRSPLSQYKWAALLLPAALLLAACAPEPAASPEPTPVETSTPDAADSPSPDGTPEPDEPASPITLASVTSAELCAAVDASATLAETVGSPPITKTIAFDDEVGCKAVLPGAAAGPDSAGLDHDMGGCTDTAREDTTINGATVASVVCSDRRGMTALSELSAEGVRAFVRLNSHPGSSIAADPVLTGIGDLWRDLLAA